MCYSSCGQLLTQIPTWLILVIGWFAVHRLTVKREQRKEARECIDAFVRTLREIEVKAISFHQGDVLDDNLARVLRFDIQRTIAKLKRQPFTSFRISSDLLKEFRRAITYKNFDSKNFKCQPANSPILGGIANAVDDIEDQLEREYERIYL